MIGLEHPLARKEDSSTEQDFIDHETEIASDRRGLILKSRPAGACAWLSDDKLCRINPVKPDKCRTFPHEWTNDDSEKICPGLRKMIYHNDKEKTHG